MDKKSLKVKIFLNFFGTYKKLQAVALYTSSDVNDIFDLKSITVSSFSDFQKYEHITAKNLSEMKL